MDIERNEIFIESQGGHPEIGFRNIDESEISFVKGNGHVTICIRNVEGDDLYIMLEHQEYDLLRQMLNIFHGKVN